MLQDVGRDDFALDPDAALHDLLERSERTGEARSGCAAEIVCVGGIGDHTVLDRLRAPRGDLVAGQRGERFDVR